MNESTSLIPAQRAHSGQRSVSGSRAHSGSRPRIHSGCARVSSSSFSSHSELLLPLSPSGDRPISKPVLRLRWVMLPLICLLMVGNFYVYDIPTAVYRYLAEYFEGAKGGHVAPGEFQLMYSLLYSAYSFPNTVLPFVGGVLVDRLGVRTTLLGFAILITLAQCVIAVGVNLSSLPLMVAGRVLFGLGGESFTVAQNAILAQWYRGRELAFTFGISLSFCRGGSVLNNNLSPMLVEKFGLGFAFWFGAGLCLFCVLCIVVLLPIDMWGDRIVARHNRRIAAGAGTITDDGTGSSGQPQLVVVSGGLGDFADGGAAADGGGGDVDGGGVAKAAKGAAKGAAKKATGAAATGLGEGGGADGVDGVGGVGGADEGKPPTFCDEVRAMRKFSALYWLMVTYTVLGYGVVMVFNNTAQDFLLERNYFKPAPDVTECCCWGQPVASAAGVALPDPSTCYSSWPNSTWDGIDSSAAIVRPTTVEKRQCREGCASYYGSNAAPRDESNHYAPPLNLTQSQFNSIACDKSGGSGGAPFFGLNGSSFTAAASERDRVPKNASFLFKYCEEEVDAVHTTASVMSIPYYINVAMSPFLGIMIDRIGSCGFILAGTPAMFVATHVLLALFPAMSPIGPLVMQGVAYGLFSAALWAPIAYIVPEQHVGMAYGVMTAVLNTGSAIFPLVVTAILQITGKYMPNVEYFFASLSVMLLLVGVAINLQDIRNGRAKVRRDEAAAAERGGGTAGAAAGGRGGGGCCRGLCDGELNRSHWNDATA